MTEKKIAIPTYVPAQPFGEHQSHAQILGMVLPREHAKRDPSRKYTLGNLLTKIGMEYVERSEEDAVNPLEYLKISPTT